jgi:superfamily II DNA or RNA helicase
MGKRQNVIDIIDRLCKARPAGYKFMPKYKQGVWDGYIKLNHGNKFPTGLLSEVCVALQANDYAYEIADGTICPEIDWSVLQPNMFKSMELRDYQLHAALTLLKAGNGIAKMATNAGKTAVEAAIAKAAKCGVLILTMKKDLLYQLSKVIGDLIEEPVGIVGDNIFDICNRVTVGTIQTLVRHMEIEDNLELCDCVMYDEVHHLPSKTSQKVLLGLSASLRFGFSGTPLRYDDLNDLLLVAATGPVRVEVTNLDLMQAGISAMPVVSMYYISDGKVDFDMPWRDAYGMQIVDGDQRNAIIARELTSRQFDSALILVDRIEHGNTIQDMLPGSLFVNGSSSMDDRSYALDMLREGIGDIVVATPIFDEGVDVPAVDLLVLAGGGVTNIKLLQRIGRGMRKKDGRNQLQVIDFVDDTNQYLLEHSLSRSKLYEQEGFEVEVI